MDTDPIEMLRLHMALECITLDQAGDLIAIPCDNPDDIHRLYIARHSRGYSRFFRSDVSPDLRTILEKLTVEETFCNHAQVKSLFAEFGTPCPDMHIGKSYVYPANCEAVSFPDVTYFSEADQCAILIDGAIVSACSSIRQNAHSAEAWVFTEENYRGQGFGKQVVQAWAQRIREQERIPFYSHRSDNLISQRLAESLSFTWYIDDVGYE